MTCSHLVRLPEWFSLALSLPVCLLVGMGVALAAPAALVPGTVEKGFGVCIHFTGQPKADLDLIKACGARMIRTDLTWGSVERERGVYDFSQYDELLRGLAARGIRPMLILDYGNTLYDDAGEKVMGTVASRAGFVEFARRAVARYKGKGIVWELWNEPNIAGFWAPAPNPDDYMKLAQAAIPAMRKADPKAVVIAPGTSQIDLAFIESCFRKGLLQLIDGVSVHPYRPQWPEAADLELRKLRGLIAEYSSGNPEVPIVVSEWGYSTNTTAGVSEEVQAQYAVRQQLFCLSQGIPATVWYDWKNDGDDERENEHRFGIVTEYMEAKPAYQALKAMTQALSGLRFVKRLESPPDDYALLFSDGRRRALAAWTTGEGHPLALPGMAPLPLSRMPQYMPVPDVAETLLVEASFTARPLAPATSADPALASKLPLGLALAMRNPLARPLALRVTLVSDTPGVESPRAEWRFNLPPGEVRKLNWTSRLGRYDQPEVNVRMTLEADGRESVSRVIIPVVGLSGVGIVPLPGGRPAAYRIGTGTLPAGAELVVSTAVASQSASLAPESAVPDAGFGAEGKPLFALTSWPSIYGESLEAKVVGPEVGHPVLAESGPTRFVEVDLHTGRKLKAYKDGDGKQPLTATLEAATGASQVTYRLDYAFAKGWQFIRLASPSPIKVEGRPRQIGLWVNGDGSGLPLRMRFTDSAGRAFQPDFGSLQFSGWRYLVAPLDNPMVGSWGKGDGKSIEYPISIDTVVLVDGAGGASRGSVEFGECTLVYGEV